ncbi:hypothetical protein ACFE04_016952 [Oxalis oulophora]
MDGYGGASSTQQEYFRIDDLLDFSNEDIFFSSSSAASSSNDYSSINHHHYHYNHNHNQPPPPQTINPITAVTSDFTDQLCLPSDDVAELEWLSQFVDDSFSDLPGNSLTTINGLGGGGPTLTVRSDTSALITSKARTKRTKPSSSHNNWINSSSSSSSLEHHAPMITDIKPRQKEGEGVIRRCTHCASEKTPQWRTGPLGPKTLCNACGVRYKSGRLVPEYRPASSPTFVLTQHSNSHRKVLELRRQKEMFKQQQPQRPSPEEMQMYHRRSRGHQQQQHQHDFEVC